jgi:large subunit ribosomal protein L14
MIQLKTFLKCIDKSGALVVECINVIGGKKIASLGDEIVCSVKKARQIDPKDTRTKLKAGEVARALVVRCRKEVRRKDGSYIKFDDNACVMLNKQGQPLGNRVLGPVSAECRQNKWAKIVSMAPRVL